MPVGRQEPEQPEERFLTLIKAKVFKQFSFGLYLYSLLFALYTGLFTGILGELFNLEGFMKSPSVTKSTFRVRQEKSAFSERNRK